MGEKVEEKAEKKGGGGGVVEKKKENGGGEKKGGGDGGPAPVVLKVDLHCEGCAKKIKRAVSSFDGVEKVNTDLETSKVTVTGAKVDAWKLRDYLSSKIKKNVDLVSPKGNPPPAAKKDNDDSFGGDGGAAKKPVAKSNDKKKSDDKKPSTKELQPSTVVLNLRLHCQGCIQRIKKSISKIKGVQEVSIDEAKELVTVKGTMDVKSLPTILKGKLNRSVEIVQPKKDGGGGGAEIGGVKKDKAPGDGGEKKDKDKNGNGGGGGGEKKEKANGGGVGGGNGEKKEKEKGNGGGGGGGGEKKEKEDGGKAAVEQAEVNKMDHYYQPQQGFHNEGGYGGGYGEYPNPYANPYPNPYANPYPNPYAHQLQMPHSPNPYPNPYQNPYAHQFQMPHGPHAPQLFSDENPNACSIM